MHLKYAISQTHWWDIDNASQAAHFGRPAQPYSAEALQWLRKYIQGKNVWCQVLSRDQYGRIVCVLALALSHCRTCFALESIWLFHQVAIPLIKSWFPFRYKCISLEMLKAGWATVYEQANAEYGKWGKKYFLKVLSQAQYVLFILNLPLISFLFGNLKYWRELLTWSWQKSETWHVGSWHRGRIPKPV